jgi:putative YphP/YqiW family bacilliredoxin
MPYDPELVAPMRQEMVDMGVQELQTSDAVERWFEKTEGTYLLFVNSVCGCAAGSARPGLRMALRGESRPDRVATVFAGQDVDAAAAARARFSQFPPSSPSAVLFKDGEPVFFMPRHQIEGRDAPSVAFEFVSAFDEFCK